MIFLIYNSYEHFKKFILIYHTWLILCFSLCMYKVEFWKIYLFTLTTINMVRVDGHFNQDFKEILSYSFDAYIT